MNKNPSVTLQNLLDKCDRCGACTKVCPLYQVHPIDRATARGKLAIAKVFLAGQLDGGEPALRQAMEYCLLCKACTEVCPSKILTDEAMIAMRHKLQKRYGLPLHTRLIGTGLGTPSLKALGRPMIALAQTLSLPRWTGGRLPASHANPPTAQCGPAFFYGTPTKATMDLSKIRHIAYFQGCAMGLFFKDAREATLRLLEKTGRTVSVPKVNCCGLPQLSHGMNAFANRLAKENIDTLLAADLIVTDCGSCGTTLKNYAQRFQEDFTYKAKAAAFSKKVMGLSEYLTSVGYQPTKTAQRLTYHASCHLNRGQGIHQEVEALLEKAGTYLPAKNATMCCGGAGTFQLDFPETSEKILHKKYEDFLATGADVVVCECPSCLMQLGRLEKHHAFQVKHISQVL